MPLSQDIFDEKATTGRMQIKRSKSANTILINHDIVPSIDPYPTVEGTVEESSGDDSSTESGKERFGGTSYCRFGIS
jgi:SET domain-containing protein